MNIRKVCNEIIEVAKNAGALILNREDLKIVQKGDIANIVTVMDIKSQNFILSKLVEIVPEAKIIAEENNVNEFGEEYVWVVDPIDGTTNYAYDLKYSCISIALLYKKEGFIGVVYNPYLDELFIGVKGHGSYLNGKKIEVASRKLNSSLIVVGTSPYVKEKVDITFTNMKKLFLQGRDIRRSGSATLDLCYVACGRFDAFYEVSLSPWDYAAAATIIQEAGGIVEAIKPNVWGYEKTIGLIAGNKNNYEDIRKLVA